MGIGLGLGLGLALDAVLLSERGRLVPRGEWQRVERHLGVVAVERFLVAIGGHEHDGDLIRVKNRVRVGPRARVRVRVRASIRVRIRAGARVRARVGVRTRWRPRLA